MLEVILIVSLWIVAALVIAIDKRLERSRTSRMTDMEREEYEIARQL